MPTTPEQPIADTRPEQEETLPDRAYEYIKARIFNMTYRPGEPLSEVRLAEELGISRTPVREALRRLTTEGLVLSAPGRGRVVYTLSLRDIDSIFDVKECLESMVAMRAAENCTAAAAGQLGEIVARLEAAAEAGHLEDWLEADAEFHGTLFEMAGNQRAQQIVQSLNEQWHRLRLGFVALEGRMAVSVQEHKRIAESVQQGNAEAAARAMREHLTNLRGALTSLLRNLVVPYVGENL